MPDLRIRDHGTVVGFDAGSERGREWLDELPTEPWQWLSGTLFVDHRPARSLIEAAFNDGLEVACD